MGSLKSIVMPKLIASAGLAAFSCIVIYGGALLWVNSAIGAGEVKTLYSRPPTDEQLGTHLKSTGTFCSNPFSGDSKNPSTRAEALAILVNVCGHNKGLPSLSGELVSDALSSLHYYGAIKLSNEANKIQVSGPGISAKLFPGTPWLSDLMLAECFHLFIEALSVVSDKERQIECASGSSKRVFHDTSENRQAINKYALPLLRAVNEELKDLAPYVVRRQIAGGNQLSTLIVFSIAMAFLIVVQFPGFLELKKVLGNVEVNKSLFINHWDFGHTAQGGDKPIRSNDPGLDQYIQYLRASVESEGQSSSIYIGRIVLDAATQFRLSGKVADALRVLESKMVAFMGDFRIRRSVGRTALQLMPMIGFIGTVVGLGVSMSLADLVFDQSLGAEKKMSAVQELMSGLAVAFDTTLVALVLSAVFLVVWAAFGMVEDSLLNRLDERLYEGFVNRFEDTP